MERRNKLLLLIIAALILLAIGLWILLKPILFPDQPPDLPGQVRPSTGLPSTSTIPTIGTPPGTLPQDLKQLQDLAAASVARIGSGSSSDGFSGYDDVLIHATPSLQATLRTEQQRMRSAHPSTAPYGIVTRVVSAQRTESQSGDASVYFGFQVQQAEDAGNPASPTAVTYKEVTVTFARQSNGAYLMNSIVWTDLEL